MMQKLVQHLVAVREQTIKQGLSPISAGVDVAYEAGRRIGVKQGMDALIEALIKFHTEDNKQKDDL